MRQLAQLALVGAALALPARAPGEQFLTLERIDGQRKLGLLTSLSYYSDDDAFAVRGELYGQVTGDLDGVPTFGAYGHIAVSVSFGEYESHAAVQAIQLGAFYRSPFDDGDFILHAGVIAPTSTGGGSILERNYDLLTSPPDTTALKLGATLHTRLGRSGFLQGDVAIDLELDVPGDNTEVYHGNLGVGVEVGDQNALLAEVATAFFEDFKVATVGLSLLFLGSPHPHIGYIMAIVDEGDSPSDGIVAHILSFGLYASWD